MMNSTETCLPLALAERAKRRKGETRRMKSTKPFWMKDDFVPRMLWTKWRLAWKNKTVTQIHLLYPNRGHQKSEQGQELYYQSRDGCLILASKWHLTVKSFNNETVHDRKVNHLRYEVTDVELASLILKKTSTTWAQVTTADRPMSSGLAVKIGNLHCVLSQEYEQRRYRCPCVVIGRFCMIHNKSRRLLHQTFLHVR